MLIHVRTAPVFLAFSAVLVPAAARAQEPSAAQVREEIDFARGLAEEWGFVDIAEEVISRVGKQKLSDSLREELGLLQCEVYFIAGKSDAARRDELLQRSLSCYEDFVARNAYSEFKDDAEAAL
ncbi:MAG TPA: hypothetical protein VMS76_03470, partial [Planctomycetota bacterium]|nr:hypothetical protein [Planctomycetota bacterium]